MRFLASLAITVLMFSVSQAEIELDNISISKHEDSIHVEITTTKPCVYEHFMIKTAPEKVVVDLKGTLNAWPKKKFLSLPLKSIARIRTSQFQTSPELITRIVLDVNRPLNYSIEEKPKGLLLKIPAISDEQAFIPWNAKQQLKQTISLADKKTDKPVRATKKKITKRKPTVKIESFPKRKVIRYKAGSVRDPFKALIGQGGAALAYGDVPAIENLILVGIFKDETGDKALFEDAEGNGFILKPSDKVQNGYLVSVQNNKAIFQVTEYGWTRTVALKLQAID